MNLELETRNLILETCNLKRLPSFYDKEKLLSYTYVAVAGGFAG